MSKPRLHHPVATIGVAAVLSLLALSTYGFEFATHAAISRQAFLASALLAGTLPSPSPNEILCELGLEEWWQNLGLTYLDIGNGNVVERAAQPLGDTTLGPRKIAAANFRSAYAPNLPAVPAWIMLGSIREDDVPFSYAEIENTPQDEVGGPFIRVKNHFYDPSHDRPLSLAGIAVGASAKEWALKDGLGTYDRSNHFNVPMAREVMWRALTLKLRPISPAANGPVADLGFIATPAVGTRELVRKAYWASTFRTLGNIVHMVQDMAQPQHTRNDKHAGVGCVPPLCAVGHKSHFEAYVEARAVDANVFTLRERFGWGLGIVDAKFPVARVPLEFGAYPVPRFASYEEYFSTGTGSASVTGLGLANYSNRAFYSSGTLPGDPQYAFAGPPNDVGSLVRTTLLEGTVLDAANRVVDGASLELYSGDVTDTLNPQFSALSVPLVAHGAFDEFLQKMAKRQFAINHHAYSAHAALLIPRAVAYSAGLLDFFFRGRLEAYLPDEGIYAVRDATTQICKDTCGFDKVKLKVKNTTPNEAMGPGIMVAVIKFHRNACYQPDLSGEPGGTNFLGDSCRVKEEEIVVSDAVAIGSLAADATIPMTFRFAAGTPIPINATDIALQVVFRGKLGNEDDAVVVTTKNIAETNYVAVHNSTDYRRVSDSLFETTPTGAADTFTSVSIAFGPATPQVPVATLAALPAPGYSQLAFLGDRGTTKMTIDLVPHKVSFGHPLSYAALPVSEIYLPSGGMGYDSTWPVRRTRGVYTRFVQSILYGAGTTSYVCRGEDPIATCTQSSLSPLTPAQARPLQIVFN